VEVDEAMLRYAILNGLRPEIAAYVTQQKVTTMEQLLEAARVAELTAPNKGVTDNTILEQLADVRSEVKRMAANWDRLTASLIEQQRSRPTSPKRVTFDEGPQRSQYAWNQGTQQRSSNFGTYLGGPSQTTWGERRERGRDISILRKCHSSASSSSISHRNLSKVSGVQVHNA